MRRTHADVLPGRRRQAHRRGAEPDAEPRRLLRMGGVNAEPDHDDADEERGQHRRRRDSRWRSGSSRPAWRRSHRLDAVASVTGSGEENTSAKAHRGVEPTSQATGRRNCPARRSRWRAPPAMDHEESSLPTSRPPQTLWLGRRAAREQNRVVFTCSGHQACGVFGFSGTDSLTTHGRIRACAPCTHSGRAGSASDGHAAGIRSGTTCISSSSTSRGSCRARCRCGWRRGRHACRRRCVGSPNATLSTTLAVLRPTPGSASSASRSRGTSPPCARSAPAQRDHVLRLGAVEADRSDRSVRLSSPRVRDLFVWRKGKPPLKPV